MTTPKCHTCGKSVYAMERMDADGKVFHKTCMKCEHCQCKLSLGSYAALGGKYYCKTHFKQLFKTKGNYNDGFGEEDAKKRWSPQVSHFNMSGMNFANAGPNKPRAVTVGPILQQGSYKPGGDDAETNKLPTITIDGEPGAGDNDSSPVTRGASHTISITTMRKSED